MVITIFFKCLFWCQRNLNELLLVFEKSVAYRAQKMEKGEMSSMINSSLCNLVFL